MPSEPEISREDLMNVVEKAREAVNAAAAEEISRSQGRNEARARIPFNVPTESVRLLHLESSVFLESTKRFLKRELSNR